ncbi:MAG: T9SS type A sorting domain-containing protein [Candidatus Kapabacteria bacterium]|nr:T9SS type A sorting domain-containing protein [Candidatus Kapabacteria bacterium]
MKYISTFLISILCMCSTAHAQWTQTNGPYGGNVRCFAVSGTNLFAGTYGFGVFLSTNNGTSWTASGLTNQFVYALTVSGTNLFAGTRDGVFLSTNNGTSWTAVNSGLTNGDVWSLTVSGTNLFAGTWRGGVFLSTNNGTSWTASGLTTEAVTALTVSGTNLFAGTYGGGVFLSTNNGTSWTTVNSGFSDLYVWSLTVSGTNLFAGTDFGGVFLSTNNGTSWTAVNSGLTNHRVYALTVSGTNLFAGTDGAGVFLSTNNGTSWTAVNNGLTNQDVPALTVSGTNLFAGTDGGGVFLSTNNGTSWTAVNSGLTNLGVEALTVSGTNLFAGTWGGVFLSTNNGTTWMAVNSGLTNELVTALTVSGTNLFAGTYGSSVFTMSTIQLQLGAVTSVARCVGDSIKVPYSAIGAFTAGNVFTAQLSDSSGSFASPVTLATITSVNSDTLRAVVPSSVAGGTRYRVRVISSNPSRISSDNGTNLVINLRPTPIITGTASVCDKQSGVQYSIASTTGTTYTWQGLTRGTITAGAGTNSITCTWNSAGTDTVRMRQTVSATGCFKDTSFIVTINPLPTPVIAGSVSVCAQQQGVTYSTVQNAGSTYSWSVVSGNATIAGGGTTNSATLNFGVQGTALIRVQETSSAGCTKDTVLSITIGSGLTPSITSASGQFSYCTGTSVTLDAGISGGTYQWKNSGTDISGATNQTYSVSQAGSYSVAVVSNGCSGTSSPQAVTEIPLPVPTITQQGTELQTEIATSYQWLDGGGQPISGATQQRFTPSTSGTYSVRVTQNGCSGTSSGFPYSSSGGGTGCVVVETTDAGTWIPKFEEGKSFSVKVKNTGNAPCTLQGLKSSDSTVFAVKAGVFPIPLGAGDSVYVELRFKPRLEQQYSSTLTPVSECCTTTGTVTGKGISLPPDAVITYVTLVPSKDTVEPGEDMTVTVLVEMEGVMNVSERSWDIQLGYDARVLHDRDYPRNRMTKSGGIPVQATYRAGGDWLVDGDPAIMQKTFQCKLGVMDSTLISLKEDDGRKGFRWRDTIANERTYYRTRDTMMYVRVCSEGGSKRLITKSPGTQLLMISPNPGGASTVELTYSVGERTSAELFVTDIHGRKVADIANGEHDMGTHRNTVQTTEWTEGVYMVVLRTPRETVSQKLVVVR